LRHAADFDRGVELIDGLEALPMNSPRLRALLVICLALLCSTASATSPHTNVINGTVSKAWPGMGAILIFQGASYIQ
jgi:hypothetical protein